MERQSLADTPLTEAGGTRTVSTAIPRIMVEAGAGSTIGGKGTPSDIGREGELSGGDTGEAEDGEKCHRVM